MCGGTNIEWKLGEGKYSIYRYLSSLSNLFWMYMLISSLFFLLSGYRYTTWNGN